MSNDKLVVQLFVFYCFVIKSIVCIDLETLQSSENEVTGFYYQYFRDSKCTNQTFISSVVPADPAGCNLDQYLAYCKNGIATVVITWKHDSCPPLFEKDIMSVQQFGLNSCLQMDNDLYVRYSCSEYALSMLPNDVDNIHQSMARVLENVSGNCNTSKQFFVNSTYLRNSTCKNESSSCIKINNVISKRSLCGYFPELIESSLDTGISIITIVVITFVACIVFLLALYIVYNQNNCKNEKLSREGGNSNGTYVPI